MIGDQACQREGIGHTKMNGRPEPFGSLGCNASAHVIIGMNRGHTSTLIMMRLYRCRPSQYHPSDTNLPLTCRYKSPTVSHGSPTPLRGCLSIYPLSALIPNSLLCPIGIIYPTPWRNGNGPVFSTLTTSRSKQPSQRGREVSRASVKWLNMLVIKLTSVRAER